MTNVIQHAMAAESEAVLTSSQSHLQPVSNQWVPINDKSDLCMQLFALLCQI